MFGLGMPEILLILAIALMVIGPKKLPDLAKTLGRALGEFKKAAHEFKNSIDMESTVREFNEPVKDIKNDLKVFSDPLNSSPDKVVDQIEEVKINRSKPERAEQNAEIKESGMTDNIDIAKSVGSPEEKVEKQVQGNEKANLSIKDASFSDRQTSYSNDSNVGRDNSDATLYGHNKDGKE